MAATALATQISSLHPHNNSFVLLKTGLHIHFHPTMTSSSKRISLVRASSKPQRERASDPADGEPPFLSQEDLKYLVKLGASSVAGAAAIKYGSIIFPEITRPNLAQALLVITAPVIIAVLLLIKQSRVD